MRTIATGRINQAAAKYGEHAPVAAVCCNACRACVQTNAIAAGLGLLIASGAAAARLGRGVFGRAQRPVAS